MQQHIGEIIRQIRRQQNLTQTSLGGDLYSKSYVSAIERGKILPSQEALSHFAEQLGYTHDYFMPLFQDIHSATDSVPGTGELKDGAGTASAVFPMKTLTLLDILLENRDPAELLAHYELPVLSTEVLAALPSNKQSSYHYMAGVKAQELRDFATALHSFETALGLASIEQQVTLLDHLGLNYYLTGEYQTALGYHLRALNLLKKLIQEGYSRGNDQFFMIELHCGDAYRTMGDYEQACIHYEYARTRIQPQHDMRTAGFLYLALGYCLYAQIYQLTLLTSPESTSIEKMDFELQRAIGFLVQSRTLYQISGDTVGECKARLTQVSVLLDLSNWRKYFGLKPKKHAGSTPAIMGSTSLNEAEEQCLQVLMHCLKSLENIAFPPLHDAGATTYIAFAYQALAYLVRVHTCRAALARLSSYYDTSLSERNAAVQLCEDVLAALPVQGLPLATIHEIFSPQGLSDSSGYASVEQLRLPALNGSLHSEKVLTEVFFATSEVAAELGFAATDELYAHYCYERATHYLQEALALAHRQTADHDIEPNFKLHCYRRSVALLEERNKVAPEYAGETNKVLLHILEAAFHEMQSPVLQRG